VRKNTLNFIVDLATLLAIMAMIGTGLIMKWPLPPGSGSRGLALWGLDRHQFGDVHFWASVALGALLILHVALHWSWICGTIRRMVKGPRQPRGARDNVYGVAFLLVLIAFFTSLTLIADANVESDPARAREHEREHDETRAQSPGTGSHHNEPAGRSSDGDEHTIRGSMTIAEVSNATGLSVQRVVELLELPADTAADARLGRAVRDVGLEMSAARTLIERAAGDESTSD
jgi:hypothetical protein